MSTISKRSYHHLSTASSFESPYVSIELLSYLKAEQKTQFRVFSEVVMPEFKRHLSNGNRFLPPPEENTNGNGIVVADDDDADRNMVAVFDEIQRDVNCIEMALRKLQRWEAEVNSGISNLVFQSLDDSFRERIGGTSSSSFSENTVRTQVQVQLDKLVKTSQMISNLKESICSQPKLVGSDSFNVSETNLDFKLEWFSRMKCVKALQLGKWQGSVEHLIEAKDGGGFLKGLKKMKQLRYLSLRGVSGITKLPDSICKLRSLRILNLNGCRELEKLPDEIDSLKKLTYLDMYECYLISHMPKGLASLLELQVLKGFVIGKKPSSGGDQHYCKLEDLTKLPKLKTLRIHVDKSSSRTEQAQELSCLDRFEKLRSLSISWSRIYGCSAPQRNFQRRLTEKFKSMKIKSMRRTKMTPSTSPSLPAHLEKLNLHYFPESSMPPWLMPERLQMLKKLYIRGGDLCYLCSARPISPWSNVEVLRLKFLSQLQMEWPEVQALFPKSVYVEILKCPKLSFFPCDHSGVWEKKKWHAADRIN